MISNLEYQTLNLFPPSYLYLPPADLFLFSENHRAGKALTHLLYD